MMKDWQKRIDCGLKFYSPFLKYLQMVFYFIIFGGQAIISDVTGVFEIRKV